MRRSIVAAVVVLGAVVIAPAAGARVLRVGTYKGIPGQYHSIQAAVNAAGPGDWILVGPGDYKERADHRANRGPQAANTPAGVVISTPRVYLRGMNRNTVVVDGTKPGSPQVQQQGSGAELRAQRIERQPLGLNGSWCGRPNNVWVQNLTTCNFLGGTGSAGNEVWWNGGDGSAKIGGWVFCGSYLNATSTFYDAGNPATAAAVRDLLEQLERRHLGPDLRQQLQRLGLLHRRLPAGLQPDRQPCPRAVQRARLLGL